MDILKFILILIIISVISAKLDDIIDLIREIIKRKNK